MDLINPKTGRPFPKDFLKDYARGQPCLIRVAASAGMQCAHTETTSLCHITMAGLKAMGKKLIPDLCGAWGCDTCHGLVDKRYRPEPGSELRELGDQSPMMLQLVLEHAHYQGMARTIAQLVKDGILPNPI